MTDHRPPQVFVIMPFLPDLEDVYLDLIKAPLEQEGFSVIRADTLLNQRNILQDVVRGIADAALVVADVTGLNANVMYELGLAHALGKRTVMITQRLDELPFDLRPYRANEYSTNFKRAEQLAELLRSIGQAILAGDADFSNPVQDYAPDALGAQSQVSNTPTGRPRSRDPQISASSDPAEDDTEPGILEYAVQMQLSNDRVIDTSKRMSSLTERIGEKVLAQSKKMERAQKNLGDRSAGALLVIARDSADDLESYAGEMRPEVDEFRVALDAMVSSVNAIARARSISSEDEADALDEEIESLRELEMSLSGAVESIAEFAKTLFDMPHVERRLTAASQKGGAIVSESAEIMMLAEVELARARGLLEERLREFRERG